MQAEPPYRTIRFGVFELDLSSHELRKRGVRIKLHEQPFQVLALLLARKGEVVTREELHAKLWPADSFVDFDHGLGSVIHKLRDALGDSADNPRLSGDN
jgi:DNA-binding winged helix-turn-helix (wHTH) protein